MRTFDIVVAADSKLGIGKNGTLPWKLPGDMAYFKRVTSEVADSNKRNAVIMGRKTWESIPAKFRPLPNRLNIVLSRGNVDLPENVLLAHNIEQALQLASNDSSVENVFVIGGGEIFATALNHAACRRLYLTDIASDFECDVFLPRYDETFEVETSGDIANENGINYAFKVFSRRGGDADAKHAGLCAEGQPGARS
jgi:dihydrofolate reductase/thymidylate synthase